MNRISLVIIAACLCFNATAQLPILKSEYLRWIHNNTQPTITYDSIVYSHSHGRNSVIQAVGAGELGIGLIANTHNISPFQTEDIYLYDSLLYYTSTTGQTWDTSIRTNVFFGANNQASSALTQVYNTSSSAWNDLGKLELVYGAGGTLDTSTSYYKTTISPMNPTQRDVYFYNAGKKRIAHCQYDWKTSSSSWTLSQTDSFWYNTAGDAIRYKAWSGIPGPANEYSHFEFAYDASHRLVADTQFYNPPTLPYYETFQYNSNGTQASSYYYDIWNGGWQVRFKTEYHYDVNNNLSGYIEYRWDMPTSSFIAKGQKTYTYNSFNQVTSSNDSFRLRKFYYGPAPVSVSVTRHDNDLLLYPVPATSYINLELHTATPQNLSISITDMSGRVVKQWTENNAQYYKKFIPVMDMAPGNYTIQVSGKETISKTFNVIR